MAGPWPSHGLGTTSFGVARKKDIGIVSSQACTCHDTGCGPHDPFHHRQASLVFAHAASSSSGLPLGSFSGKENLNDDDDDDDDDDGEK